MKLQKQIILDNVDKVKAFVMTVSKYPGDATLVSGTAELAKEVQVYESQEV